MACVAAGDQVVEFGTAVLGAHAAMVGVLVVLAAHAWDLRLAARTSMHLPVDGAVD